MEFLHHYDSPGDHLWPARGEPVAPFSPHEPWAHERAVRLRSTLTAAGDRLLAQLPPCLWDDRCWCSAVQPGADQVVDLRAAPVPVPGWRA